MSDYIRREDAPECVTYDVEYTTEQIKGLPPADVVPVVHGKWVDADFCGQYECSECGNNAVDLYDFCPNCGAKMDGEECGHVV